jgi:alpha-mannosidase
MSAGEARLRRNAIGLIGAATLGAVVMAPALSIYFNFSPIAKSAGKTVPLVYVIALLVSLPTAISYALVSRELPSAGSAYTWLWEALSKPVGVWLGLVLAFYYLIAVIIQPLMFGLFFNDALEFAGCAVGEHGKYWTWLLGVLVATAIVGAITYRGIRVSTATGVFFLVVETLVVAALAVSVLCFYKGTSHSLDLSAFDPGSSPQGHLGIFKGLIIGVLTFIGYDVICTVAEEAKTPRKLIPVATLLALLGPGLFAILTSWALASAVPMADILPVLETQATPITPIAVGTWGRAGTAVVIITGMTSALGVYIAATVGCSRVLYAMGRDQTLPAWFGRLHPRFQAPWNAQHVILLLTLAAAAAWGRWVGLLDAYIWWGSAIVLLGLTTYLMVNAANFLFYYRFRRDRFRWSTNAAVPAAGLLLNGYLLYKSFFVALSSEGWKMGTSIVATGMGFMVLALCYTLWLKYGSGVARSVAPLTPDETLASPPLEQTRAPSVDPVVGPGRCLSTQTRTIIGLLVATCLAAGTPLASKAGESSPRGIYIVPQAHIDVAWFWRYDPETIEVCIPATFGQAADNLEQVPEYSFSASQVPLYEGMRQYHPRLAARVEKLIREGRWEIVGGHWTEFEGAGPCGEALVRNCVYGKRYFKDTYGVDVRNAWLPDTWTHPWTLPQIFRKCEIDAYIFHRGGRGEDIFWWESADGSRVLGIRPFFDDSRADNLDKAIEYHRQIKARYGIDLSMSLYGRGDHGGGMSRDTVEKLKKQMSQMEIPARFSRADTFLKDLTSLNKKDWPVLHDELEFELTGCIANTGRLKAANRRSENRLIEAEKFAAIASRVTGTPYPKADLKTIWLDLLFNHFHDVISGAVIPAGYEDAMELFARIEREAMRIRGESLTGLCRQMRTQGEGTPVVLFNSLSWPHTGPVEVELDFDRKPDRMMATAEGQEQSAVQVLRVRPQGNRWRADCLFIARDVPGIGYKTYWLKASDTPVTDATAGRLRVEKWELASDAFALTFDPKVGDLTRVRDLRRDAELLSAGSRGNEIQLLEESGSTEGMLDWGKQRWSPEPLESWNGWKVIETGPVRATVRIRNKLPDIAAVDRFVTLYADPAVPWVQFRTHFEWNGVHKMVKIAFPTSYRGARPTFEIPYGTIVRDADGEERPAQRWVDLGDETGGVSLLNDCRYGHDVKEGVIRLDAIRSLTGHATHTEAGNQEVTYALCPHTGDWRQGRIVQRGYEFNNPLIPVVADSHDGRLPPAGWFARVDRPNVILSVLKQAEDGEHLVVRAYETAGEKCSAAFEFAGLGITKAELANMLERPLSDLSSRPVSQDVVQVSAPVGAYEIGTANLR